jgi:putative colanic acid biosynthesis glycosyltransferase
LRILQINSVCGIGSTGRIATDIDSMLKMQDHESYVAFGRDTPKNCDTAIRIGTTWDVYHHVVLSRLFDKHGFGSRRATQVFVKEVERLEPDVIHLHNLHGYYLNVELLFDYLRLANKPVVWTLHDCWAFTGHCAYFDYVGCNRWRAVCSRCPQRRGYPKSILADRSEQNFHKKREVFTGIGNMVIATPSKWLAKLVEASFLRSYPIRVINNGIDVDLFQPIRGGFRETYGIEKKFVILGVANIWSTRKGLSYFIELSKMLGTNDVIVLVGLTKKQLRELPANIIGITRTDSIRKLAQIYSSADVFVNPTMEDNFPTTNLEALACGTPVITFDTGGSVEVIDENCGFVVEKGKLDDVLACIEITKKRERMCWFERARARAISLYDKNDRLQ